MTTSDETATISKLVSSCPALLGLFAADGDCIFIHGAPHFTNHLRNSTNSNHLRHIFSAISEAAEFWEEKLSQVRDDLHTIYIDRFLSTGCLTLILFPYSTDLSSILVGAIAIEVPKEKSDDCGDSASVTKRMLGIIGHELRNPLAALDAGIKLIELRNANASNSDILDKMKRQIQLAVRLVNDLVDTTHVAYKDGIPLTYRDELLSEVINFCLDTFQHRVAEKRHSLTVIIPDEPVWIRCDLDRLSQAITNLVHNACKYTPKGGRIELAVDVTKENVAIIVSDNGVGIPPDKLTSIFEPFTQIDTSSSYADGGVGLGLFLVKAIIEGHGGTIHASSPGPDGGSVFNIRIPRACP